MGRKCDILLFMCNPCMLIFEGWITVYIAEYM